MADYKDTLNLPHTDFPMKANLGNREPAMLANWLDEGIYQKIRALRSNAPLFVMHDGPPYANGHLHSGHALNKILKDIIVKSKTLSGFNAPFIPGWDCHGLPIELNVEKKHGRVGVKINAKEFREKCREYAASQIEIQKAEFQRLGVFADWNNPYITMDYQYEADIVRSLGKMIENGHLQQGVKPVHWCMDCGSALAEAEVEYEDKVSSSIDVAFFAVNPEKILSIFATELPVKPLMVPIWTTTPWTLPANQAVSVHPDLDYVLIDTGEKYLILADALYETCLQRYGMENFTVKAKTKGKSLEHAALQHPFLPREVSILCGTHVTVEAGTGSVHTAPAHGPDDFMVAQQYGLTVVNPVASNGCYTVDIPQLAGISVLKANQPVLDLLTENNCLIHAEKITHSYPHCWRHKTPIVFLATPQWFIAMDKNNLRTSIMEQIDTVNWVPDWGKARIKNMVESRPDWCISRQRAWGTPMPLFIHKTTRALHPDTLKLIETVALRIEKSGIEAWFSLDAAELLGAEASQYDKSTDTMDVWLDSGVSHYCVLQKNNQLHMPADVYFEGSDQHRGWFNSSLTTAVAIDGVAPYKTVLTHGYTVDGEGKKLSKSKGNFVALDKLIAQHGAEILRLWVASMDYRHEVAISDEILKRNADAYRRIRNTARFLLSNLFDFNPATDRLDPSRMMELDLWAIKRTQLLQDDIVAAYDNYQFHVIYQKIHNFCALDLGGFYLDIIKDRQYTAPKTSAARRSCQTAMYYILQALVRWLAPILSYTAEEIWRYMPAQSEESVFLQSWYAAWPTIKHVDMESWEAFMGIRDEVNKALEEARKQGVIGSSLAAEITIYADERIFSHLIRHGNDLRFLFITSEAKVLPMQDCPSRGIFTTQAGISIKVIASPHEKCERCWHRMADVGADERYPDICGRCISNISIEN